MWWLWFFLKKKSFPLCPKPQTTSKLIAASWLVGLFCLWHPVFTGNLPSKHWQGPALLNFQELTRLGVFRVVRLLKDLVTNLKHLLPRSKGLSCPITVRSSYSTVSEKCPLVRSAFCPLALQPVNSVGPILRGDLLSEYWVPLAPMETFPCLCIVLHVCSDTLQMDGCHTSCHRARCGDAIAEGSRQPLSILNNTPEVIWLCLPHTNNPEMFKKAEGQPRNPDQKEYQKEVWPHSFQIILLSHSNQTSLVPTQNKHVAQWDRIPQD